MSSVVRHVNPVAPRRARDLVAEVYRQVDAEFSSIGPAVQMTSPAPEILAPGWALLRESQLVGRAPGSHKTMVALGVAQTNRCVYDEEAFLAALRMNGATRLAEQVRSGGVPDDPRLAELLAWGRRTGNEPSPTTMAPFDRELAPEFIGTALFTHFINRLALAMLPPDLTPGSMNPDDEPAFADAPVWRQAGQKPEPGATLSLFETDVTPPLWANGSPAGVAYAALSQAAGMGAGLMSEDAQWVVAETIAEYRGRIQPEPSVIPDGDLKGLSVGDRLAARVAILAGLAPGEITDDEVAAWRATDRRLSDHCTVFLLSFGAMIAVAHVEALIT